MKLLCVADREFMERVARLTTAEMDQITAACLTLNRVLGTRQPSDDQPYFLHFVPLEVADVLGIQTTFDAHWGEGGWMTCDDPSHLDGGS